MRMRTLLTFAARSLLAPSDPSADHLVSTPKFGSVYFGDGIENSSLQFML